MFFCFPLRPGPFAAPPAGHHAVEARLFLKAGETFGPRPACGLPIIKFVSGFFEFSARPGFSAIKFVSGVFGLPFG
jgi:hypothetical protein